jgi:hypothetical protein
MTTIGMKGANEYPYKHIISIAVISVPKHFIITESIRGVPKPIA